MDQVSSLTSNDFKAFCNGECIEITKSTVKDHWATGCVERTIGSLKNSIIIFVQEKHPEPLEKMIEKALGALMFSNNATLKVSPLEAHHGREANTVLRNLTKKLSLQNLDWSRVIKTKSACLDEAEPNVRDMPRLTQTIWGVRSDLAYDINHRSHSHRLTDEQAENQEINRPSLK